MTQYTPGHDAGELPPTLGPQSGGGAGGAVPGDLVGTVLAGRYRILRKLGEGAMGNVYLGEHLKIGRQDAIKVLRDALSTDTEAIARFIRGTRNVSMIRHPNICTIYDYSDTAGGLQFVAMELVTGETLRDLVLREGALPLKRAVHIAKQVADALQAAHEAGIVHRDLKPANVMITRGRRGEDEIKVVDFDIAKGPRDGEGGGEEVTRLGFVVGTPEYMSPEQLIGDRLDGRSDLYSLGLLLFRMLTGMLPFRAEGAQDLIIKRLTEEPLRLSEALPGLEFPEALEQAIRRSLARRPEDRQADAEEFGEEIVRAVGGAAVGGAPVALPGGPARERVAPTTLSGGAVPGTVVRRPAGPASAPAARRARPPAIAVAAVAVVALALGGGGGFYLLAGGEPAPRVPEPIAINGFQGGPVEGQGTDSTAGSGTTAGGGNATGGAGTATTGGGGNSGTRGGSGTAAGGVSISTGSEGDSRAPVVAALDTAEVRVRFLRLNDRLSDPSADLRAIFEDANEVYSHSGATPRLKAQATLFMARSLMAGSTPDTLRAVNLLEAGRRLDPTFRSIESLFEHPALERYRTGMR
jgi:hypothetical protein